MARVTPPRTAPRPSPRPTSSSTAPRGRGCARTTRSASTADDVTRLRGLGDRLDLAEVEEVYLPLSRLLNFYVGATAGLHRITTDFLGEQPGARRRSSSAWPGRWPSASPPPPASCASCWPAGPAPPAVELVTTDGFLYPNAELERRGLLQRKGFPESYDRRALLRFVAEVKAGKAEVSAPVYSHLTYDIVPRRAGRRAPARRAHRRGPQRPAAAAGRSPTAGSAWPSATSSTSRSTSTPHLDDIRRVVRRAVPAPARDRVRRPALLLPPLCRALRRGGPGHRGAASGPTINEPNLRENVLPTRGRATLVLGQGRGPQRAPGAPAQALSARPRTAPGMPRGRLRGTPRRCRRGERMMGA